MTIIKAGDPNCPHRMTLEYGETPEDDKWICRNEGCGRIEANPTVDIDYIVAGRNFKKNNKPQTNLNQVMFQLYGMKKGV